MTAHTKREWLNAGSANGAYAISSWDMREAANGREPILYAALEISDGTRPSLCIDFTADNAETLNECAERLRVLAEVTNEIATALRCYQVRLLGKGEGDGETKED